MIIIMLRLLELVVRYCVGYARHIYDCMKRGGPRSIGNFLAVRVVP